MDNVFAIRGPVTFLPVRAAPVAILKAVNVSTHVRGSFARRMKNASWAPVFLMHVLIRPAMKPKRVRMDCAKISLAWTLTVRRPNSVVTETVLMRARGSPAWRVTFVAMDFVKRIRVMGVVIGEPVVTRLTAFASWTHALA